MRESAFSSEKKYEWIVYAIAMVLVGGLAGYMIAVQNSGAASVAPGQVAPAQAAAAPAGAVVDESQLQAYRDILTRDPKNLQAAVTAGNLLYDAHRYVEAIPFYQQAFALSPSDINISTDLGTALWYAGRADDALAQYDKSLALSATHAQTLFNSGVVKADGKHDYAGAITSWEKLLASNPTYENAAHVRQLIADARTKVS